jgi:hypothetical protein
MKLSNKHFIVVSVLVSIVVLNVILFVNTKWFNNDHNASTTDKVIDGIYFSTTCVSSVGFGDLTPQSRQAKIIVVIEQLLVIAIAFDMIMTYMNYRK